MEKKNDELNYMRGFGYPEEWIQEGKKYGPNDSYIITKSSWVHEQIPKIPLVPIYELFDRSVKRVPDDIAVIFLDKSIKYKEMDQMIKRYVSLLLDLGIKKGDVVATMLPNSLQHWIAFYGATIVGATHTPINVMYKEDEISYQIRDSGAKTVITLDGFYYQYFSKLKRKLGIDNVILTNLKDWASPAFNPETLVTLKPLWDIPRQKIEDTIDLFDSINKYDPTDIKVECNPKEDVPLLLYTAGTTGVPKGVLETHFNLVFNSLSHTHQLRMWKKKEVDLSIMPMFHTAGYMLHCLPTFYQGGTVVPIPIFHPENTLRIIQQYKVNVILAPATFYIALLQHPKLKVYDLSSLELTIGCGAPVPLEVQHRWQESIGISLTNGWGMTETNSGGCISTPGKKEKLDSIGIPVASEMKIVDHEGKVVPRNEQGECLYRGFQVAKGYLNKPEETKETFLPAGWMRTGDIMYIDDEDFVHFVDREKDLIIASGYNVAPVEVENVLYQHPAVLEAAVVGVPDPYRGETVKAFVSLKENYKGKVTEQEIIDFCKGKLADFKRPRMVEFLDEIPKNIVGKALRRALREREMKK